MSLREPRFGHFPASSGAGDGRTAFEQQLERGRQELGEGEFEAAARSFAQAVTAAQGLGDQVAEFDAVNLQARAINELGQPQRALSVLNRALRASAETAPADKVAIMRSNAGELQRMIASYPAALENLMAAQAHFDASGHMQRASAVNLINTGLLYQDMGRQSEARRFLIRAQETGLEIGDRMVVAVALNNLANSDMNVGNYVVAAERFRGALTQSRELAQLNYQIDNLDGLGQALAALGNHEQAREVHAEAYEIARSIGDRPGEMELLISLGRDNLHLGRHDAAVRGFQEALDLAEQLERPQIRTELHGLLSEAFEAAGDPWAALRHARVHTELAAEVFHELNQQHLQELQVRFQLEQSQREAENYRQHSRQMKKAVTEAESLVRLTTGELYEAQIDIVERLALAAEFHDNGTGAHNRRVARNAVLIAYAMGLADSDLAVLFAAAKLHDVGKVAVSDMILHKPGRLSEEERELIEQHTVHGASILSGGSSRLLQTAERISLAHHEKFDGSGYPDGLKGQEIPMCARIVAVADVLDALVHARHYKAAWPVSEALAEIKSEAGRHFDPAAVKGCMVAFSDQTGISPLDDVQDWPEVERQLDRLAGLTGVPESEQVTADW